ncbi:O-antigen ligase family protein [Arthrobacter sp. KNU-44]|uniref:O-antigen ligase family protein n=1 Tax=unclassified Arthrobacter TaxID=235627 RepID=UPI003F43A6E6
MIQLGDHNPVGKRYYPHEWALAVLGFVMPLGAATQPAFLASPTFRTWAAVLAAFLLCLSLLKLTKDHALSSSARYAIPPLIVYMIVVGIATARGDLPSVRYQLFALFPLAVFGFYVSERFRPGSWLRIVYAASVGHLIMAVATGSTRMAFGGVSRLEAGTSAVLLGFEASLIVVLSLWFISRRRYVFVNVCVFVLAGYCLFAAFSRAAFVSLLIGSGLVFVFWGRGKVLRFLIAGIAGTLSYSVILPKLIDFLGANDLESLYGASGRYRIWGSALTYFNQWFRGYGFTALYDNTGPDAGLKLATFDLPLENSLLEALFMAGIVGAALWLWLFWRSIRVLWRVREASGGLSLAMLACLSVSAFYSVGLSGVSYDWWWLLAAFSFAGLVQETPPRQPMSAAAPVARFSPEYRLLAAQLQASKPQRGPAGLVAAREDPYAATKISERI